MRRDLLGTIVGAALLGGFCYFGVAPAPTVVLAGMAETVDGDTFDVAGVRVRLWGIDAPEWNTEAGQVAKATMRTLLARGPIRCNETGSRSHGRTVATCQDKNGADIGRELIAAGVALDCARYSRGFYAKDERPGARSYIVPAPYCGG